MIGNSNVNHFLVYDTKKLHQGQNVGYFEALLLMRKIERTIDYLNPHKRLN